MFLKLFILYAVLKRHTYIKKRTKVKMVRLKTTVYRLGHRASGKNA